MFAEFKLPPQMVLGEAAPAVGNYVRFRIGPQVAIALGARAKRPGEGMTGRPVELSVVEQPVEAAVWDYERLLGDTIAGDTTLFARQDVVEAAWAIVNPLVQDPGALHECDPDRGDLQRPISSWRISAAGIRQCDERSPPCPEASPPASGRTSGPAEAPASRASSA